jgi:Tfp pilus assembly PilM family ATPase
VRVEKAVTWAETQNPQTAPAETLGPILREHLKAAGIAPAPVLVCVGRERLIVKDVRFPAVGAEEEPALVRFQVVKELTESADEAVIDYLVTGQSGSERRALAMVVPRKVVATYQNLCKAAGMKLASLTPRLFGILACVKQSIGSASAPPELRDAAVAVLTVGQPWAEFCVVKDNGVLFARPLTAGPGLAGEVRRNLALYAGQSPQHPIRALYIAGQATEHSDLRERLHDSMGLAVQPLDPFAGQEAVDVQRDQRGVFAGPMGLLLSRGVRAALPINFVQPREPKPAKNPNQLRIAAAAAVAALLLLGIIGFSFAQMASKDKELARLMEKKDERQKEVDRFDEDGKRVKAISDWLQGDVCWLDELYDLTDRFPDVSKIRVTRLTCQDNIIKTGKEKYAANMIIAGITTEDPRLLAQLEAHLVQDGHYRPDPDKKVVRNPGARTVKFRQAFTWKVDIEKIPPAKYTRRLPETADSGADALRSGRRTQFRGGRPGNMGDLPPIGGRPR